MRDGVQSNIRCLRYKESFTYVKVASPGTNLLAASYDGYLPFQIE
jgi:hypothetical protein